MLLNNMIMLSWVHDTAQRFCIILGGVVTIMGQDGKPVQVSAAALQAGGAQNAIGKYFDKHNFEHRQELPISH